MRDHRMSCVLALLVLAGLVASCGTAATDRVCSLDQSSMHIIKCWGACNRPGERCVLRWRAAGSEDDWDTEHRDSRDRNAERDAKLEYSCFCEGAAQAG